MVFFGKKPSGFSFWDFLIRNGTSGVLIVSVIVFFAYVYLSTTDPEKRNKKHSKSLTKKGSSKTGRNRVASYDYKRKEKNPMSEDFDDLKVKSHRDSGKFEISDDDYDCTERHHKRKVHHDLNDRRHWHKYEARHRRHMHDSD